MSAPDGKGVIAPGGVIGVLGGGQLGRMTACAAARLGYSVHAMTPDVSGPTAQVAAAVTPAWLDDAAAVRAFAEQVDVVTYESENIPIEAVRALATRVPVRPKPDALAVAQDRLLEKRFVSGLGIGTARFAPVSKDEDLAPALAEVGLPAVLKTNRLGYDGKGQRRVDAPDALAPAWQALGRAPAILESFVDFAFEVSVVIARGLDGEEVAYPAVRNEHRNHVLHRTLAPADIGAATAHEARRIAETVAASLDLVGVLAVEMFVGVDGSLLVNELAPRPHNSGHWTLDAAPTCQFEQLVRAICGLPLGAVEPVRRAEMVNLLGDDVDRWPELVAEPGARVHLYGKRETRPGRKMGHVTRLR